MLLKSSSTPVLGSLLSSFSDSPNNNNTHFHDTTNSTLLKHNSLNKLPYHLHHQTGCINLTSVSCNSSPISPSIADLSDRSIKGFRRAQSDGNLEGLASAYGCCSNNDEQYEPSQPKKILGRSKYLMLETIPSFSYSGLKGRYEDEVEEKEEYEEWNEVLDEEEEEGEQLGEIAAKEGSHFGFSKMGNMVLSEQMRTMDRTWNVGYQEEKLSIKEEMYLARGLGTDGDLNSGYGGGGSSGGGNSGGPHSPGGDGGDMNQTEEYYKRMLQENPGNPLFLRNYAQFLYQSKRDLPGAEEYYSRAISADPKDGEILSQYAKLIWELHHDLDRASGYFERAAEASPDDSHVQAVYASFLWEVEEEEDECNVPQNFNAIPPSFHDLCRRLKVMD